MLFPKWAKFTKGPCYNLDEGIAPSPFQENLHVCTTEVLAAKRKVSRADSMSQPASHHKRERPLDELDFS